MSNLPQQGIGRSLTRPSGRIQSLIEPVTAQLIAEAGSANLVALAVVGSASRGEETWLNGKLIGDIDLMAILREPNPLISHRIESTARNLGYQIGCYPLYTLRRYCTIEFFEARMTGWVFWGPANVFECIPINTSSDIPEWEAIRLLLNRAADCLKARAGLIPTWYGAVKTFLALGEADLIFKKQDMPSYRGRNEQVRHYCEVFGSHELLERVHWATRVKLGEEAPPEKISIHEYEPWLLNGLDQLLKRYLNMDVTLEQGLDFIDRRNVHWAHRLFFLSQHLRQPHLWYRSVFHDPIFEIWRVILRILDGKMILTNTKLLRLLADFDRTLQPLWVNGDGGGG